MEGQPHANKPKQNEFTSFYEEKTKQIEEKRRHQ
jgi:hypothetical protein